MSACSSFRTPRLFRDTCLAPSSVGSWLLSWPLWPPWKTLSLLASRPSWLCLWSPRLRFPPWVMRSCGLARARTLLSLKLLPIVLAAPFCSASGVPLVWPSRVASRLRQSGLSPPTAALAPRSLLLASSSPRAWPARSAPPRPCRAP